MLHTTRTFPAEFPLKEADVCLLGIPWDSSEIGKSVKHGPMFIREALKDLEWFDPETGKNIFEGRKWCDLGNLEAVPNNWNLTKEKILDTIDFVFRENPGVFPVFLGGDHLVTLGILEGLKKIKKDFTVVHFDAHADLSRDWLGEKNSHIAWGHYAIKELGLDLVQLGVRSCTKEEAEFLEKNKEKIKKLEEVEGPVYLTVDMDVFDSGFAPEVGTPEPAGLNPKEVMELLKKVCGKEIVGMDIVECASDRVNTPTASLAGHIIKKVILWK